MCRSSSLTKYIFSDCHQTVLQRLKDNITNCLTNCDSNSVSVCVEELDWENVSDEQLQRIQANTIIAAGDTKPRNTHTLYSFICDLFSFIDSKVSESDHIKWCLICWVTLLCLFETDVVYDPDIIACLVRLLSMLLNCKVQEKHPDVYIVSAVRNPQTYDCFKKELGRFRIINNITFYSINVKYFLNSWFPINNEIFILFTEMAGLRHVVMKDSVTQVFPYNRASTLEMIKLYVWQKQSLFNKVFIYIIFTRIVCFLFSYSSLSQWHCWNADCPDVGTVS